MILEKKVKLISLFDIYKNLLTESQKEVFEYYFLDDISMIEIAEIKQISKQAVKCQLDKCTKLLNEYESLLKISERLSKISNFLEVQDKGLNEKVNKIWWGEE